MPAVLNGNDIQWVSCALSVIVQLMSYPHDVPRTVDPVSEPKAWGASHLKYWIPIKMAEGPKQKASNLENK